MVDRARGDSKRAVTCPDDLLGLFLAHSTDGVAVLDGTGHITTTTPGFERMLGMAAGALEGADGVALVHPEERDEALATLDRMTAFGNGSPSPKTFRLAHADGTWIHAELLAAPGHLEDGRMVITVRDVTAWAHAEQALQKARALQEVVSTIAARFVDTLPCGIDATVEAALGELGTFADSERAYVFRFSDDLTAARRTHRWVAPGLAEPIDDLAGLRPGDYREMLARFAAGECVHIPRVANLDASWHAERSLLHERGLCSIVVVPMTQGGRLIGFMGFGTSVEEKTWDDTTITLLRVAADVIGSALARRDELNAREAQGERFRTLMENSLDQVMVLDANGRHTMPPLGEDLFGYDSDALVSTDVLDIVHPDDHERVVTALAEGIVTPGYSTTLELRARASNGEYIPIEIVAVNRLDDPAVRGIVVNLRDIRQRLRYEGELRESEERFRTLVGNLPGAVYRCEAIPPYRDEFVSEAVFDLSGYPAADFLADRVLFDELILPGHRERTDHELGEAIEARRPYVMEYPIRHRDGSICWISEQGQISFAPDGTPKWLDGVMFDITPRKGLEERLAHDAAHDPLTGLPNRTLLLETLNQALGRATRLRSRVATLFLDLDRFKLVNDALGHAAGDELLVAFARRLSGVLRASDVATRTGGDEFVVVCSDIRNPSEAEHVAQRIAGALRTPFEIRGREVFVTASIGIALADPASTAADLLRDADAAAYRAKDRGRNRYELFDEALRAATAAALEVETALHRAIDEEQLLLRYQPVVDLRSGAPVGFEGLLRWQHPERGILEPAAFLDAAEASGLIVPIGRCVIEMACGVLGSLPGEEPLTMAVNLSPRELAQPDLVERVRRTVLDTGVQPERLCLEITESALLEDVESAVTTLAALKDLGVRVAIDDFGTGYSSLNYLRRLPVDIVKIDRSFISELGRGGAGDTIIAGIIGLALGLGLDVVAEGIEEAPQAAALLELGCTLGQGFLYSPAVTIDQALAVTRRPAPR